MLVIFSVSPVGLRGMPLRGTVQGALLQGDRVQLVSVGVSVSVLVLVVIQARRCWVILRGALVNSGPGRVCCDRQMV